VISVLLFHIGLHAVSGGFVGVDIFFVISGYLISSIIFAEVADGRFSILRFYERRIRRIFPALFATLAVVSVFAGIYLLPLELVNYAKSMLAATTSASNFYFWSHSSYFNAPTSQPLLHTWSLAVEEQFYLSFPLFLVLVRRFFPHRLKLSVVVLFFVSLLLSAVVVFKNPGTAFYMPYTRAWELLMGTILSLHMFPRINSAILRNLVTVTGTGLIAFSVIFYRPDVPVFPGLSAIPPCLGTALIIWAGEAGSSLVGKCLSWRPVVFIGLISYSLYLWHWPVVVLRHMGGGLGAGAFVPPRFASFLPAHRFDMLLEITLSLLLGTLSWKFVEQPFRNGRLRLSGKPLFSMAAVSMAILLGVSAWTVSAKGFEQRFPAAAVWIASSSGLHGDQSKAMRTGTCFITSEISFERFDPNVCLHEVPDKQNYLLLGDSHSAMLWSALSSSLPNVNVMQATSWGCEASLDPAERDCRKMMHYIFQDYLPTHPARKLFIAGQWADKDMGPLTGVIAWARDHHLPVTIVGPMPEYDAPLPRLLAYSVAWNKPNLASEHRVANSLALDQKMQNLAVNTWHVPYVSLYQEICGSQGCIEYADAARTIPLMYDMDHLNHAGADIVVRDLIAKGQLP
jgi:peptidoglycan/LPS O-acetylase OafA/YrhL